MTENKSGNGSYIRYLFFILMLTQILDTYATLFNGAMPSAIAAEFLSDNSAIVQDSIMAFANGIVSIGMIFLFFSQYLADRLGRKKMLGVTVGGIALASFGIFIAVNYVMYMVFVFFLYFFFSSDIWLIYVNEEVEANKRAYYSNVVMTVGLVGAIIMVIFRLLFITETDPFWRGMAIFPMVLGFLLCLAIFFSLKEPKQYREMKESGSFESRSFKEDIKSLFQIENRKPYMYLLLAVFIRGISSIYIGLFEKYIDNVGILNQQQVTSIFLLTIFMVIIAYGANGLLADRIGRKPLLYIWSALAPISVLIWVLGANNPENAYILVLLGFALSHISYWGSIGILRLLTIEMLPTDRRGIGVGFRSLIGAIGGTIGLLTSSVMILSLDLGPTFIIFIMGNFAVIPIVYFFLKETKGVELSEIK